MFYCTKQVAWLNPKAMVWRLYTSPMRWEVGKNLNICWTIIIALLFINFHVSPIIKLTQNHFAYCKTTLGNWIISDYHLPSLPPFLTFFPPLSFFLFLSHSSILSLVVFPSLPAPFPPSLFPFLSISVFWKKKTNFIMNHCKHTHKTRIVQWSQIIPATQYHYFHLMATIVKSILQRSLLSQDEYRKNLRHNIIAS